MGKRKSIKKDKYQTVGRSKNKQKAQSIAKSYGKGYQTKVVKQKSGYAVKLLVHKG